MGVCNCSMFCCTLLYVHSSIAIILVGKRELVALLNLSSWCLMMVERLFLAVPRGCMQFVIVVFPDHTHLLFLSWGINKEQVGSTKALIRSRYTNSRTYTVWREHCSSFNPITGWFCTIKPGTRVVGCWALNGINQQQNHLRHMPHI